MAVGRVLGFLGRGALGMLRRPVLATAALVGADQVLNGGRGTAVVGGALWNQGQRLVVNGMASAAEQVSPELAQFMRQNPGMTAAMAALFLGGTGMMGETMQNMSGMIMGLAFIGIAIGTFQRMSQGMDFGQAVTTSIRELSNDAMNMLGMGQRQPQQQQQQTAPPAPTPAPRPEAPAPVPLS